MIPPLCQSTAHFRSGLLPCWRHGMPRPAVGQSSTRQTRRFWLRPGLDATEGGRGLTCHSPVSLAGVGPGTTGGGRRPHAGPERRVPGPGGPHHPVRGGRFRSAADPADAPGTSLLTVSGRWLEPRIVETPLGVPLGHLLGIGRPTRQLQGVLLGGYGGGWLPTTQALAMPLAEEEARRRGRGQPGGALHGRPEGGLVRSATNRLREPRGLCRAAARAGHARPVGLPRHPC
jgi:hypothetical protein